jgi:single-stranded-DNA-specific exonuclease
MAAGLRLPESRLEEFAEALNAEVALHAGTERTGRVLWTDGPLEPSHLCLEFAEELHFAGPWGQGFPEPLFENDFAVLDQQLLKDAHLRLSLRHPGGGEPVEAIAFHETRNLPQRARFLYRLAVNDFGGRRRRQLVVEHVRYD